MKKIFPFLFIIIPLTIILHHKSITLRPTSAYAWAQADHYALAVGFVDNGMDFFHPKTWSLNHQYPPAKIVKNPQGITAADFPILQYIVASVFNIFGTSAPWIYRTIVLLYSLISLTILYLTINRIRGIIQSLLIIAFITLQPCYAFYQDNFHVTSTAFNTFLIGFSFLLNYLYYKSLRKYLLWSIFFLTLAALQRFIQIIPLIALGGVFFLNNYKKRKNDKYLLLIMGGIIVVICYFIYNKYLAYTYGSIFIGAPQPIKSIAEATELITQMAKIYIRGVLPLPHFIGIILLLFVAHKQKTTSSTAPILVIWLRISALGSLTFSMLMLQNMSIHDYYAIDVWLSSLLMLVTYLIFSIDFKYLSFKTKISGLLIILMSLIIVIRNQEKKYDNQFKNIHNGGEDEIISAFYDSKKFLDDRIPKSNKILVICESGWNIPLIGYKRDAYRIAGNNLSRFSEIFNQNYDVIITYNKTFYTKVLKPHPEFLTNVEKIDSNSLLTIWKKHNK